MFGISGIELFVIVVFALIIFGPDKLPQFGRTVGRVMREFKRAQENMESMMRAEMYDDPAIKKRVAAGGSPAAEQIEDDEEEEDDEE